MQIFTIPCLEDNYAYILRDDETNTTTVVDAPEFGPIDKFLVANNWKLNFILNTHHHWDHVQGNRELKQKYNCKILGSEVESSKIPELDEALKDKQIYVLGSASFEVLLLPGHTNGQINFYFEKEKVLFSGDTLFSMGCGRLLEGTADQMFESLQKIKTLPVSTQIYCGHEYAKKNAEFCMQSAPNAHVQKYYVKVLDLRDKRMPTVPTSLELELKINPFLRAVTLKEFIRLRDLRNEW